MAATSTSPPEEIKKAASEESAEVDVDAWKRSLPVECDLGGYFTSGASWSQQKIVRLQLSVTSIADPDAPYLHLKRLLLTADPTQQLSLLDDGAASPIRYLASCPRPLKKSSRQDQETSQDPARGKYRPQMLCDNASSRSKWVAQSPKPGDPVLLDLLPAPPATSFPLVASFRMVHGIRSTRRPKVFQLRAFFDNGAEDLLGSYTVVSETVSLSSPSSHYTCAPPLLAIVDALRRDPADAAAQELGLEAESDGLKALVGALNHSLDSHFGFAHPSAPSVSQLLLRSLQPPLVALAFNRHDPAELALLDDPWAVVLASRSTAVIRLALNHGLPVTLKTFVGVIEEGLLDLLDLFIRAQPDLFYDNQTEMVTAATSGGYDMLFQVLNKLKEPRKKTLPSLPPHPALENPSHLLLLSSYRCPDKRLFEEFMTIASGAAALHFFHALAGRNPPDFPLPYLRQAILRGMPLHAPSFSEPLLALAVAASRLDVAELLLAHGASFSGSLGAAVSDAFRRRDLPLLRLLQRRGAPLPLLHLFSALLDDAAAAPPAHVRESVDALLALGLPVDAVGLDGRSLLAKAIAAKHFVAVDALLQAGAPVPPGPSLFSRAQQSGASPAGLLSVLRFRDPATDLPAVSLALYDAIPTLAAEDELLSAVADFLAAGADPNYAGEASAVDPGTHLLARLFATPPFSLQAWRLLRAKGAQPAGPLQDSVVDALCRALAAGDLSPDDFQTVVEDLRCDDCALLLALLDGSHRSRSPVRAQVIQQLLERIPDLAAAKVAPHRFLQLAAGQKQGNLSLFKQIFARGVRYDLSAADAPSPQELSRSLAKLLKRDSDISPENVQFLIDAHTCPGASQLALVPAIFKGLARKPDLLNEVLLPLVDREDIDPNENLGTEESPQFVINLLLASRHVNSSIIAALIRNGADLGLAESAAASKSLLCDILHSRCQDGSTDAQNASGALLELLIDGGCNLYAKDEKGVPFPHAVAYESGQHSHRRLFKRIWRKLLEKEVNINLPLDQATLDGMTLSSSSFTHFVTATPRDFNYRANENMQRFFNKRGGVRNYS